MMWYEAFNRKKETDYKRDLINMSVFVLLYIRGNGSHTDAEQNAFFFFIIDRDAVYGEKYIDCLVADVKKLMDADFDKWAHETIDYIRQEGETNEGSC